MEPQLVLFKQLIGHQEPVLDSAISPTMQYILTVSKDKTIKKWDFETGELLASWEGHTADISCITIATDGKFFVTGSADKTIKVWDANSGQLRRTIDAHSEPINKIEISDDNQFSMKILKGCAAPPLVTFVINLTSRVKLAGSCVDQLVPELL